MANWRLFKLRVKVTRAQCPYCAKRIGYLRRLFQELIEEECETCDHSNIIGPLEDNVYHD